MACYFADNAKLRILCVRQFQNKIEESVYSLLKIQIERFGLKARFDVQDKKIYNRATGSEFMFYGLWRSIDEIKSLEGIDILWIEEAHNLTEEQWKVLEATIRKQGSQVWVVFNPRLSTDFAYKRFVRNPPPDSVVRKINYDENPFLSETMKKIIETAKEEDYENYLHIYEGVPRDDDDASVIKRSHLMAAIDAHKTLEVAPLGTRRMGFDVADAGEDSCAMVDVYGSLALWSDVWKAKEDELLKSCGRVWSEARDRQSLVIYDAIGVGATCGAKFNELNELSPYKVQHQKFFAGGAVIDPDKFYDEGSKVKNRDFFANIKAQAWWLTADRLRNTYNAVVNGQQFNVADMIFLDSGMPNLDALIDELATPLRDYDQAGRVKVEGKKDLAKRGIPSPNLADAFIQANSQGLNSEAQWAF